MAYCYKRIIRFVFAMGIKMKSYLFYGPFPPLFIRISSSFCVCLLGLLRLQELFQRIRPGSDTNSLLIEKVRRVENYKEAIDFLISLEMLDRFVVIIYTTKINQSINSLNLFFFSRYGRKFVVLDCSATLASEIIIQHVKDVHLGRRNYHYLLSGLVSWCDMHNFHFFFIM